MINDPERENAPDDTSDDEAVTPVESPETDNIREEGEPLGGNVA